VLIADRVDGGPFLKEAWDFVTGNLKPDLVWLRKVRADSSLTPFLSEACAIETLRTEAPFMDLDAAGDFKAHLERRSARFRKRQRSAAKRLAELGPVAYQRRTHGREAGERARHAIALKRAQLSKDGVLSPALADPRMVEFFAEIATARVRPVGLNVDTLAIDGDLAAVNMFIGCKDRAALHVIAYDLRFEKASVGSLLLQHTIAEANTAGYRTFDFLAPADAYKLRWADGVVPVSDWAVPLSWKGHAFARGYLGLARPLLKLAFNALPLMLRRFIADQRGS
jgi:CelD/BcsL family acetyltransferase involved in cellulose biosynthesis